MTRTPGLLAVEAGRTITRDGVAFVSLNACKNPVTGSSNFPYVDADAFAHRIVHACNAHDGLVEALEQVMLNAHRLALQLDNDDEAQPSHGRAARDLEADARAALKAVKL